MSASRDLVFLGISGSLRSGSYNSAALRAAAGLVPDGVTLETADISAIPLYNDDVKVARIPDAVEDLRGRVERADALLIVSPEYNFSVPGVLKNAIDWLSRTPKVPFVRKPTAIMGASQGVLGTARCQYHLRQVLTAVNAYVVNKPEVMIASAAGKFDAAGNLTDQPTREHVAKLLQALADWTRLLQQGGAQ
jgi:chromate reductase